MNRRHAIAALSAAGLALSRTSARAQTPLALTVATIPIEPLAAVFYAKQIDAFARAGLDVTIQTMNNGPAIAAAVISGAVDIGASNLISLAIAHAKNVPLVLIAPAALYRKGTPVVDILVRKDATIQTAADLTGKTIAATPLNGISQWSTDSWIDANGGDSTKVRWVEIPGNAMGEALRAGRVDATVEPEPLLTHDRAEARVLADPYPAVADVFLTSAYFSTAAWAKAHPAALARFALAIRAAGTWANANATASGDALAKITGIDRATIARVNRVTFADRLVAAQIQPNIDLAKKYGAIDRSFPAAEMIAPERPDRR